MSDDQQTEAGRRLRRLLPVRTGPSAAPFVAPARPLGTAPGHARSARVDVDLRSPGGDPAPVGGGSASADLGPAPVDVGSAPANPGPPPRGLGRPSRSTRPDAPGPAAVPGSTVAAPSPLPGPGAFDPGRRGVRALAVLAALVVLGAGFFAWRSRPQVQPVVAPSGSTAPSVVPAPQASADGTVELVVAVAGRVRRPGLVRLPAGARVADAIEAAGGAQPGVDVALLNPARKVTDGELIVVGVTPPPGAGPAPGAAGPAAPTAGGKINLNTATVGQLDTLPGVGPVLAQRIVDHRDRQGGFRSIGDLRQVEGIGDARYEQLKDLVTV